jgi:hypothetical protein
VCICCIGVVESRRHGATVSWRWTQCDGHAQDGAIIWRRGGVDGRHGKVNVVIPLDDGFEEDDGDSDFCGVCNGVR